MRRPPPPVLHGPVRGCTGLRPIDHIVLIAKNCLNGQSDYNRMI